MRQRTHFLSEDPTTGILVPIYEDGAHLEGRSYAAIPIPRSSTYSLGGALHDLIVLLDVQVDKRGAMFRRGGILHGGDDVSDALLQARKALNANGYPFPCKVFDE